MKHKIEFETCDECGKKLEAGQERIYFCVERPNREEKCDVCSYKCAIKAFETSVKSVLGWHDTIGSEVDDLTTDLWGGAGPDCCTKPVKSGN